MSRQVLVPLRGRCKHLLSREGLTRVPSRQDGADHRSSEERHRRELYQTDDGVRVRGCCVRELQCTHPGEGYRGDTREGDGGREEVRGREFERVRSVPSNGSCGERGRFEVTVRTFGMNEKAVVCRHFDLLRPCLAVRDLV